MGASRAKRLAVLQRRQQVADLYLQSWTQVTIAEKLGVAQPTICDDLKQIRQEWRKAAVRDFDLAREIELKKLERTEREAWEAWKKSQKPSQEATVTNDGAAQKTVKKVAEQCGDPRFLEIVHKCIAGRRALLGLDAPTKVAPTSPDGAESYHSHVMAHLMRLAEQAKCAPDVIDGDFVEHAAAESSAIVPRPIESKLPSLGYDGQPPGADSDAA